MTVRAQVTAVLVILALVGMLDFATRVYVPRDKAERNAQLQVTSAPKRTLSLAEARQRLQSWLPDPGSAVQQLSGSETQQGASDDGDRSDRGELGSNIFVLRGVFDTPAEPTFAVVEVTPKAGGAARRYEANAGDTIEDVRVDQIAGRRVRLSDGDSTIELALFLGPERGTVATDKRND